MDFDALTVRIHQALESHRPTRGMKVAMGETCGYWTGQETAGKTRPVGIRDALNWHRAEVVREMLAEVPDENAVDRGFGNCPHCRSPLVAHCHECLNDILRDEAHAAGWRMDHLSGYGCIALCSGCR
jgi:hypothetical protein